MTEPDVVRVLARHFEYWHNLVVCNDVGLCHWEADLIVVRDSGWAEEIEVKVTLQDFKADAKKTEKHRQLLEGRKVYLRYPDWEIQPVPLRCFSYAAPIDLARQIERLVDERCPCAGLYAVRGNKVEQLLRPRELPNCRKPTAEELQGLLRRSHIRQWRRLLEGYTGLREGAA